MGKRKYLLSCLLGLAISASGPAAVAAENVVFISGAFRRSIPVSDLKHLAETGQARGLLADLLRFSSQDPEQTGKLLNQSVTLPVVLVSRLLNTRIGEALLERLATIVHPLNARSVGLQALRSAVVMGIVEGDGSLSAISFLLAYPAQQMEVSLPALMALTSQASSVTDLVRFFSESPLDGLRGNESNGTEASGSAAGAP